MSSRFTPVGIPRTGGSFSVNKGRKGQLLALGCYAESQPLVFQTTMVNRLLSIERLPHLLAQEPDHVASGRSCRDTGNAIARPANHCSDKPFIEAWRFPHHTHENLHEQHEEYGCQSYLKPDSQQKTHITVPDQSDATSVASRPEAEHIHDPQSFRGPVVPC